MSGDEFEAIPQEHVGKSVVDIPGGDLDHECLHYAISSLLRRRILRTGKRASAAEARDNIAHVMAELVCIAANDVKTCVDVAHETVDVLMQHVAAKIEHDYGVKVSFSSNNSIGLADPGAARERMH